MQFDWDVLTTRTGMKDQVAASTHSVVLVLASSSCWKPMLEFQPTGNNCVITAVLETPETLQKFEVF